MSEAAIATAIRACAPKADASVWSTVLAPDMQSSGIVNAKRIAMFIGQCAVETAYFTTLSEDLCYTHEANLRGAFPSRFPVGFDPAPYLHKPEMLADYVYGGRNDLGNTEPGDGWRFRGGGLIQITGRWWFTQFGEAVGKSAEDAADWVRTPEGAARSACWFWTRKGLNAAADNWIVTDATKLINPALASINARIEACNRALAALASGHPAVNVPAPVARFEASEAGEEISQKPQNTAGLSDDSTAEEISHVAPDPDHSADELMAAEQARTDQPA